MDSNSEMISPFAIKAADKLAAAVIALVKAGKLDARSEAGDAVLSYASIRFGDRNPIGDLEKHVENQYDRPPQHR